MRHIIASICRNALQRARAARRLQQLRRREARLVAQIRDAHAESLTHFGAQCAYLADVVPALSLELAEVRRSIHHPQPVRGAHARPVLGQTSRQTGAQA